MSQCTLQRTIVATGRSVVLSALGGLAGSAWAQGPTSAAIGGRVLDGFGRGVQGVEVVVTNQATGISMRGVSRGEGRYLVSGLEVGGPYAVTARRIGSPMKTRGGLFLSLGQQLDLELLLEEQPVLLQAIETRSARELVFSRSRMGTEALLSDSVIQRMPVINRDLYDLIRLVPQMSTWFALAGSGAGPRVNSIRIDGVSDQSPASNNPAGATFGGRVIPLDAVKEYQVSFSPFDVRHGGFAGASVNVVTRGGTNELRGSLFAYGTNERLGANVPFVRSVRHDKRQFGFSLGGPIVRDRLLFFVASELQRRTIPATGPYVGQAPASPSALPVSESDVARFQQLLTAVGLDGGSAGVVTNRNPSSSVLVRLDAPLARWNSRITVRGSYTQADSSVFARPTALNPTNCPPTACFPLASLRHSRWVDKRSAAVQLISNFAGGAHNEFQAGFLDFSAGFRPAVRQPLILVSVPGPAGTPAVLQSGTHEVATGQKNRNWTAEFTNNFSISAGAHRVTLGLSTQLFDLSAFQLRGSYGVWEFASLDSLQNGTASRYRVTRDTGSVTAASGAHHAVYVGDEWSASSRLLLTFGVRADASLFRARPPYVAAVDSIFHFRSDHVPSGVVHWSPRFGFNYRFSNTANAQAQLRGGAGLFTGRPPLFWLFGGFSAYGLAERTLRCGPLPSDAGPAPGFRADFRDPPLACAGGQTFGASTRGEVDVIAPHLRLPQTARVSLALDRELPFGIVGTIEGLYTRSSRALFFSPLNLAEPVASDRHGRRLYGTISATGLASPNRVSSQLGEVVAVTNHSKDYAYDFTGELSKRGRIADVATSLSLGRSHDVQSVRQTGALLADNWRFARPVTGRQNDLTPGISDFDQPVRIRVSGTLHSPWRRWPTDVSFFYVGGSGFPYTYVAGGTQGRGDLNADGGVGNDPIYIPRTALDTAEITFGGSQTEVKAQQAAFERFVDGAACLRQQRGRIMARNSCRSPWMHLTNLAVLQALHGARAQALTFELQVFNVLNLLSARWGRVQLPSGAALANTSQIALLSQIGETRGPPGQPIYRFDPTMRRYTFDSFDTYYQIQMAVRWNF
jgi:hypothetical protein